MVLNSTVCPGTGLSFPSFRVSVSDEVAVSFATILSGAAVSEDLSLSRLLLSAVSLTVTGATAKALPFSVTLICALPDLVPFRVAV
ncbi:Uncharacterised protein [Mycobacterium tuberculosis]|nr:Uncharacterised protein [Mycobacterium tuberculosis]